MTPSVKTCPRCKGLGEHYQHGRYIVSLIVCGRCRGTGSVARWWVLPWMKVKIER